MPYADREAKNKYQREWMARRREEWIAENGPCVDCGSSEDLEIDHKVRSTKAMNPTQLWSRTRAVREAELAKCVVRCSKCHLAKTSLEVLAKHGTIARYNKHGCRCEPCRKVKSLHNKKRIRT